jgi:serine/threonine-protein kinase
MVEKKLQIPKYTEIRDTYTITGFLGEGAFGGVYQVRHKYLGLQALKVFHPGSIAAEQEFELFSEAYLLSKFTHPNIVRVYEANTFNLNGTKYSYIAMEYVNGGTLSDFLNGKGCLSPEVAFGIQKDICRGLALAHQMDPPVVHRDIKPQNIMLSIEKPEKLVAKVSDFGLAKHVDPLTRVAKGAGTLAFMPPEGFWDYETPASDVFSAGIIFYMMLTGIPPYEIPAGCHSTKQQEIQAVIKSSRNKIPNPPSKYNLTLDKALDPIVLRALEPDIKKRYKTAMEFLNTIERYILEKEKVLNLEIQRALRLGTQYATLKDAISVLDSLISKQSEEAKKKLTEKYTKVLKSWKQGMIM